jgi:hypothetical protein
LFQDLLSSKNKELRATMTEYNASDLLSRLRADREGIMETRRLLAQSRLSATSAEASPSDEESAVQDPDAAAAAGSPSDLVAAEEMGVIREIRAKVERVDSRLTSLQEWVAETRAWTERVELAHRAQCDLGRLVLESQLRVDQQVKEAEAQAAQIVADAEQQARHLLAAAERAAAEVTAAAAQEPVATASPETASHAGPDLAVEDAAAEELYDAIELFTRTNAELVNELSALLSTIPAREQPH